MSNDAHRNVQPPLLGLLDEILGDTKWTLPTLHPSIDDLKVKFAGKPPKMAEILKEFTLTTAWVEAKLIKTGSNSRTTSSKGVRRMKKSITEKGYMPNHMVVIYPADLDNKEQYPGCKEISRLTAEDKKHGIQFFCADGMHRVRCVTELEEEHRGQATPFNNKVNAIILRPDIPPEYLLSLSISKYSFFTFKSIYDNNIIKINTFLLTSQRSCYIHKTTFDVFFAVCYLILLLTIRESSIYNSIISVIEMKKHCIVM